MSRYTVRTTTFLIDGPKKPLQQVPNLATKNVLPKPMSWYTVRTTVVCLFASEQGSTSSWFTRVALPQHISRCTVPTATSSLVDRPKRALRRVCISSCVGASRDSVAVHRAYHDFSLIDGPREPLQFLHCSRHENRIARGNVMVHCAYHDVLPLRERTKLNKVLGSRESRYPN